MDDEIGIARDKIDAALTSIGLLVTRLEEKLVDGASSDKLNSDARMLADRAIVLGNRIDHLAQLEERERQRTTAPDELIRRDNERGAMAAERAAGA